ncbi:hypothetical protein HD806DRAFT_521311 [Xylariaceae sp. AK1471]|nr:hypothetical protein HD806DRAFT_521311 [Xylariaceae sp. AK1471]
MAMAVDCSKPNSSFATFSHTQYIPSNSRNMTSFGQLNASAATFRAEATNALVNVNLEFNVFAKKFINPPSEYAGVGQHLATKRLHEAQDGTRHGVARRLGALFKDKNETLLAITGETSRSDLSDWDASARAWLRVADQVMTKQQTQAKLIIDNLDIPVNSKPDTYDSVIDAWASSMRQMEKLLCGIPLQVHRGDILLGLLSWHLYPDMKCLLKVERTIRQNDPLLTDRGIITLSLEPSPRVANDCQSVYWALPLAHLRYYGRLPVTRLRSMRTTDRDRITVDEMLWAMVSSYILAWADNSISMKIILEFVSNIAIELHYALGYDSCTSNGKRTWLSSYACPSNPSWLTMISRVCLQYKDRLQEERVRKLQALGRRFHPSFKTPFEGILNVETYLRAGRFIEDKIKLLREITPLIATSDKTVECNEYEFIISYKYSYPAASNDGNTNQSLKTFEYATAFPELSNSDTVERSHKRWIVPMYGTRLRAEDMINLESRRQKIQKMKEKIDPLDPHRPAFTHYGNRTQECHPSRYQDSSAPTIIKATTTRTRARPLNYVGGDVEFVKMEAGLGSKASVEYTVVSGSLDNVALLRRRRKLAPIIHNSGTPDEEKKEKRLVYKLTLRQLISLFQPESVDFTKCAMGTRFTDVPLHAMTLIENLYRDMGNATIDVRAVQVDFTEAKWVNFAMAQARRKYSAENSISLDAADIPSPYLHARDVDTATCFASIAMMETGSYDLDPKELRSVFGLCASDSLYIASCFFRDPADRLSGPSVLRFTGNIGRAGMAFMVPPIDPEVRRYDLIDEWYQYDHKVFTGVMEDCFQGTTLHISFSEASQAVNVNFSRGPDVEAYFLETLISVYSCGEWIAELDILGSVTSPNLTSDALQSKAYSCKGATTHGAATMISIDNFAEMLVPPNQPGIIRAKGNWQARLAATALCLAKGYKVVIKNPNTCLECVLNTAVAESTFSSNWRSEDVLMII